MFKNYLIVSFRSLLKNRLFTSINLFGLALGITASFLVLIYVYYHNSFDLPYKKSTIYRVLTDTYTTENQFVKQYAFSMHFLGPAMQKDFSAIEESVRLFEFETLLLYSNDDIFFKKTIVGADSNVLTFFNLKMISGDAHTALTEPRSAVLTASMAKLLFKDENPVGKTIGLGYGYHEPWQYKITGVMEDLPTNTHMRFDVLTSAIDVNSDLGTSTIFSGGDANYYYPMFDTYVKVRPSTDLSLLEGQLNQFLQERIGRIMDHYGLRKLHLQHISSIHLRKDINPHYLGGMERRSLIRSNEIDQRTITWISYGAIVLLLFSIFNYVNLTYINSINRFKEISLRKIFGSSLPKLFLQFFIESFLLTFSACCVSMVLIFLLLNSFYEFIGLPQSFSVFFDYKVYMFFFLFILSVILIKSFLLFLILLSINHVGLQRGNLSGGRRGVTTRKALMIGQLIASFVLISGTMLLGRQIDFFMNKNLGFDKDNLMVIRKYTMASGYESVDLFYYRSFKAELKKSPAIEEVCLSTITPGFFYNTSQAVWATEGNKFQSNTIFVDHDYASVYKLKLLAGRFFSDNYQNETGNAVINRKLMGMLGFHDPKEAIGQTMYIDEISSYYIAPGPHKIIGVLEDFYQEPLSNGIAPIKFHLFNANRGFYSIRFKNDTDKKEAIDYVRKVFAKFYPKDQIDYVMLDDFLKDQYKTEEQIKKIMQLYTYASILIAYLGLLAFSVYLIQQKKKSIAIRKVLGSSSANVVGLLLKEYFIMLVVSFVVAIPVASIVVQELFESYANKIPIGLSEFIITCSLITLVVIGTIARQALKATFENPVNSLRYE